MALIVEPEVLVSQSGAIVGLLAVMQVVRRQARYTRRYLYLFYAALGFVALIQILWLVLGCFEYFDQLTEWTLKNEGVTTDARVLASRPGYARHTPHASKGSAFAIDCEFTTAEGRVVRASVRASRGASPLPPATVPVSYLPADPSVAREREAIDRARPPAPKGFMLWATWGIDACLVAWLFLRRAARLNRLDRP